MDPKEFLESLKNRIDAGEFADPVSDAKKAAVVELESLVREIEYFLSQQHANTFKILNLNTLFLSTLIFRANKILSIFLFCGVEFLKKRA